MKYKNLLNGKLFSQITFALAFVGYTCLFWGYNLEKCK